MFDGERALAPATAAAADAELRHMPPDERAALGTLTGNWKPRSILLVPERVLGLLQDKRLVESKARAASPAFPVAEVWWRLTDAGVILARRLEQQDRDRERREAIAQLPPEVRAKVREQERRRALLARGR